MVDFGNPLGASKEGKSKESVDLEVLYHQIGHQKVEIDFLKKVAMKSRTERLEGVDRNISELSILNQCFLLSIHRSGLYCTPTMESLENLEIMRLLDEQYFKTPLCGEPKLTVLLREKGCLIDKKRTRRLMKLLQWRTIYRETRTTISDKTSYTYPYLLKGLKIERKNQVWATDITCIPMKHGIMYLIAIIDLHSRFLLNWSISNAMTAQWCTDVVSETIEMYGKPEIFNSDQRVHFTSEVFIKNLLDNDIRISMDEKGRAIDNIFIERLWRTVKYEHVYLHVYENGLSLYNGLKDYFKFYNHERFHQSLDYKTPSEVFLS